jgi:hypothetical protein
MNMVEKQVIIFELKKENQKTIPTSLIQQP